MTDKCYSELLVCVRVVAVYNQVQCITSQITGQGGRFLAMFSTKILAILAIIVVAVFSPALISQAAAPPSVGTASIEDDKESGDSVVIALSGISPGTYTAALISANGVTSLDLGSGNVGISVINTVTQDTGTLNITFGNSSDGYDGSDLLAQYSRITISGPDGMVAYSDHLPSAATAAINSAIADGKSLNDALDSALASAKEAQSASDKTTIDSKMDATVVNVVGIVAFADSMEANANAAIAAAPDEAGIRIEAARVSEMVANIKGWVNTASTTATTDVKTNSSVVVQKIFVDSVVNNLDAARNGFDADGNGLIGIESIESIQSRCTVDIDQDDGDNDGSDTDGVNPTGWTVCTAASTTTYSGLGEGGSAQAYSTARNMANFALTASPLPAPEAAEEPEPVVAEDNHVLDLGLPSVGEKILANIMKISMLVGVALMGLGGLFLVRNRS